MIDKTIGVCRLVYNLALEVKIRAYQEFGVRLSAYDIQKELKYLRKEYKWIADVDSQAVKTSVNTVDWAFKMFFAGKGYPRFKSKRNGGSLRFEHGEDCKINFTSNTLFVPKIKGIPIVISRKFSGESRTITVSKTPTGKYFASVLVRTTDTEAATPENKNAIGIDLGIKDFAVVSTGEKISKPKHLQTELKRLKVLQHRASRKIIGSKNWAKANLRVAVLHERITSQRKDFLHKLSSKLIGDNQTDTICIEDLAVKNMVKNHKLAQAISDVSWGEFVRQLEYKGKWYGKNIIKIDRWFASSKTCSNCGHKYDELNLSERTWDCSNCGTTHDRDVNAAINIRNSGMGSPGEPVELSATAEAKKQELMSSTEGDESQELKSKYTIQKKENL